MDDRAAFLRTILASPNDDMPRLVYADWLEEYDDGATAAWMRAPHVPGYFRLTGYGYGYGYGYGDGDGDGDGDGYGYGYGYGDGDGYGYGYGYGDGDGYGYGYGYGSLTISGEHQVPTTGKNQLIILPNGWVICGFVAEQIGLFHFRVENASVICRTNGVPWDELADGKRRNEATYRQWGTVTIGPSFVVSREWVGNLPG